MDFDRASLIRVLEQWHRGEVTAADVQAYAESVIDGRELPDVPPATDESIDVEVLMFLDTLPLLLITPDDVPAFVTFLSTPVGRAEAGWRVWREYWDSVDHATRRKLLGADPFYVT